MTDQEMFQRVNAVLTAFPELHRQNFWEKKNSSINGSCGTTRCVAGWAVWLKAMDLGLISRKRDRVGTDILCRVADHLGISTETEYGDWRGADAVYLEVGAVLLGLNKHKADDLFMDMSTDRVTRRVKSYAETGEDISAEEYDEYDEE